MGTLYDDVAVGEGGSTRALTTNDAGNLLWNPMLATTTQGVPFTQYSGTGGTSSPAPSYTQGSGMVMVNNGHDDPINGPVLITGWSCKIVGGYNGHNGCILEAYLRQAFNLNLSRSNVLSLSPDETKVATGDYCRTVERILPTPMRLSVGDWICFAINTNSGFMGLGTLVAYMHWRKL